MKPTMTRGELRVIADTDHVQCGDAETMANMLLELLDGWIKCSERMPEQKQSNRYIGLNLLLNERTVVQGGFDDGSFWLDGERIDNVTRWMPLPAAPDNDL